MISLDLYPISPTQLAACPSNYNEAVKAQFYAIPGIRYNKKHDAYVGDLAGIEVAVRICEEAKLAIVASRKLGIDGRTYVIPAPHPHAGLLFGFQRAGVEGIHRLLALHGAALLGDDRGIGKTPQAIVIADAYAGCKVIVAPAMVVPSWRREIAKWSAQPDSYYVYSYEEFQAASKLSEPKKRAGKRPLLPLPQASIIILDEAQYISESRSKRSQAIHAYCRGNPSMLRLALSGTPINSRVKNIWHLLDVLFPGVFGPYWNFTKRYCDGHYSSIKGRGGEEIQAWEAGGHSNLEELQARLAAFMVRRVKSEVEIELPPKTRSVIDVELPSAVRKSMKQAALAAGLASQLSDRSISVASLLSHVEEHKLDAACALAQDCIADGRRPLILSTRIASAETLARRLGIALAYGSTPPEERIAILSRASAACSTIDAVQVGITLVNFDVIIFVGFDWTPAKLLQAEDRISRIGQEHPCHIYYLCGVNSIDEIVRSRVIDRLDQFEKVLGSEDSNLRAALNSISDEEILQSYAKSLVA